MENNRRSFFKEITTFFSGVVATKVASYIPKKEEEKEEMMVSNCITLKHGNEEYHPIVVKKTIHDNNTEYTSTKTNFTHIQQQFSPKIRKVNT
jgi:hypothetical protein